jgi:hypothetical protein
MGFLIFIMTELNKLRISKELESLRPDVFVDENIVSTTMEQFQNQTLRPIIKYQNNLLISFFLSQKNANTLLDNRGPLKDFEEKMQVFLNQSAIKYQILGIVIGLFTEDEHKFYQLHSKDLSKRIYQIVAKRLCTNL